MDLGTQRFIAATKKLFEQLQAISGRLSLIHDDLERAGIDKASQAAEQKPNIEVTAILHTPEAAQAEEREYHAKQDRHQNRNLIATWAGVIVVAAYTTFAALQWRAARHANEIAETNFRRDERGWMAFKFMEGSLTLTVGKSFLVPTQLVNTGKTPAKNIHGNITVGVFKKGEHLDFIFTRGHANYAVSAGTMFPNGSITQSFEAIEHGPEKANATILTKPLLKDIFAGDSLIIVHGRIIYNDIFGIEHWTTYCRYVLHPDLISPECMKYNDTDDR